MRTPSGPSNSISIPALAAACGYSGTWLYSLVKRGQGPQTHGHGKLTLVPLDAAIRWVEARLRGRLPRLRRARMEDALKDLRVARVFYRSHERRRQQHSARSQI